MTEAQQTAILEVLIYKRERLKFSIQMLEIRQKQATRKLQDLVKQNTRLRSELKQIEASLAGLREGTNKEQTTSHIQRLSYKIYRFKIQIEPLLVKVLFEFPLAVAMEKAQLQEVEKFLKVEPGKGYET